MSQFFVTNRPTTQRWLLDGTDAGSSQWFSAVAAALQAKGIVLSLGNGVQVASAADAQSLVSQLVSNPAGLAQTLGVDPSLLKNYLTNVFTVGDNCLSSVSSVANETLDVSPSSQLSGLLSLASANPYASAGQVVQQPQDTFTAGNTQLQLDPMNSRNYMDQQTYDGTSWNWPRDATEIEVNRAMGGIDPKVLNQLLQTKDSSGKIGFAAARKPEALEPYVLGYSGLQGVPMTIDEMRWDDEAHQARMATPYVNLTIEDGNYERQPVDPANPTVLGARQASLGTDDFFDAYLEASNNALEHMGWEYRPRDRRDQPTNVTNRRLLTASKDNTHLDPVLGAKLDHKMDTRTDSPTPRNVTQLIVDSMNGSAQWNGGPLQAGHSVYDAANAAGLLQTAGPHTDILELMAQMYVDSQRSRLHFNESPDAGMRSFMTTGLGRVQSLVDLANAVKPTLNGKKLKQVTAIIDGASALNDASAIAKLAIPGLQKLDPSRTWTVDDVKAQMQNPAVGPVAVTDLNTLEQRKVVADATALAYANFAKNAEGAGDVLSGSQGGAAGDAADAFQTYWQQQDPANFASMQSADPFLAKLDAIIALPDADRATALAAFNTWLTTQKDSKGNAFKPLDDAGLKALRPELLGKAAKIWAYQVAEAGQMAQGLYFDEARSLYSSAARTFGNFIINTFDWSNYLTPADWDSIPDSIRNDPTQQLPLDKVFFSTLINENQIELGNEAPYVNAGQSYADQINNDRSSLMMKYLDSIHAAGVDPTQPATYAAALKALLAPQPTPPGMVRRAGSALKRVSGNAVRKITPAPVKTGARAAKKLVTGTPGTRRAAVTAKAKQAANLAAQKVFLKKRDPRQATVDAFNAFLKAQGSALNPVTLEDLQALPDADFTTANYALPVRTDNTIERKQAGNDWVFHQLMDIQAKIVDARMDRVRKSLAKTAAAANISLDKDKLTWTEPPGSKLQLGLAFGRSIGKIDPIVPHVAVV